MFNITPEEICKFAIKALKKEYKTAECALVYKDAFELLVGARLAAQCTDARVNIVTPDLFKKYKNAKGFANANLKDLQQEIHSCGFFRTKAQDIINMSKKVVEDFNGNIPDTMEELTSLPGVGRKTANLVLGDIFKKPAIIVDTHFMRLTRRLGLHNEKNPEKIERILRKLIPERESTDFCHRLVMHGRAICNAKKPKCSECCLKKICTSDERTDIS